MPERQSSMRYALFFRPLPQSAMSLTPARLGTNSEGDVAFLRIKHRQMAVPPVCSSARSGPRERAATGFPAPPGQFPKSRLKTTAQERLTR